jgi:hypothetical protein
MANGYNQAMKDSSAKYKVYLHQDTFIINQDLIKDVIKVFNDHPETGLLGVIGCQTLPKDGVWWHAETKFGKVLESREVFRILDHDDFEGDLAEAEAMDGLIMITQYDLPWREDILDGWHFYDIIQSLEFQRNGYKCCIVKQKNPWCLHYCGETTNFDGYEHYQNVVLKRYLSESSK